MERCASCGLEIAESALVCDGCGAGVALTIDPAGEDPDAVEPRAAAHEEARPPAALVVQAAAPAPRPPGLSPREVLAAAVAIMAAGVLTFALLMTRGAGETAAAAADPAESVSAAAPVPSSPHAFTRSWSTANVDRWVANGRTFAIELSSENRVAIWQRHVTPVLVVRCRANRLEAFVFTDSPAKIEPKTDDHTVRVAFDGESGSAERWPDSADHDALFAPDGAAFVTRLANARALAFGFTPHNAAPVVAHFNVAGLRPRLEASRECGWKP